MIDLVRSLHAQSALRSVERAAAGGPSPLVTGLLVAGGFLLSGAAMAGVTTGVEFKAATDDINGAGQGYGGLLVALIGAAVGLVGGALMGKINSALSGFLWAFVPAMVFAVVNAKYAGLL